MNKEIIKKFSCITLFVILTFLGCSPNKTIRPAATIEPPANDTTTKVEDTEGDSVQQLPLLPFKYIITSIPSDSKIDLNTTWEDSPLKEFKATIQGKGEKALEEGYSHIIIKDENTNKIVKLTLEDEENNKITAKDLEWIDENNMLVILGQPFGTVSKGGKIYKVNIKSGEIFLYEDTTNLKEEFISVHKLGNNINFEKFVYDDDNFTKGHTVGGVLELK